MQKGNINKNIFFFALPVIFSMIAQQLYNLADTVIVGRFLGASELGAVGNAGNIVILAMAVSGGIELGSEVAFSGYTGAGNFKKIADSTGGLLLFTLFSGVVLGFIGILFSEPIMALMDIPEEMQENTKTYMLIYFSGMFCVFLYDIVRAVILSLGDSKTPLFLVLFSSALNIALDLLLVCVFQFGVAGAAFATIFSQFLGLIAALICMRKSFIRRNMKLSFSIKESRELIHVLKLSFPTTLQQLAGTFSVTVLQALVNGFGTQIISGYTVVSRLFMLFMIPIYGFAQAESVFAAQNTGAGERERVGKGFFSCNMMCGGYSLLLIVITLFLSAPLAGIFIDISANPEASDFIVRYLQLSFPAYLLSAFRYTGEAHLRGLERMKAYLAVTLTGLGVKIIATAGLSRILGSDCFFTGNIIGTAAASLLVFLFIFRGKEALSFKMQKNAAG